jgi:hypothetical protein
MPGIVSGIASFLVGSEVDSGLYWDLYGRDVSPLTAAILRNPLMSATYKSFAATYCLSHPSPPSGN